MTNKDILEKQVYYWTSRYALLWKQYKELSDRGNETGRLDNLLKAHSECRENHIFED